MARILCNFDVASLYPSIVKLYGYSSRNQKDKGKYVETLNMRLDAKYGRIDQATLDSLGVTNDDLKVGLKLPINAYTGALRATFNPLYDPVQGFSICTTGQLFILQLIYDLQKVPTLEMVSANTDAVMFTIEEENKQQAIDVLEAWQKHTGLELEEDKIVKIIMRDVNNYCEILQTGENDYKVNYKGGEFKGKHKFKWNRDKKIFEYSFDDEIEANSMTIIGEALLKNLLFDIPIEKTILDCDDIFRFQIITHLGSTYEKIVQETPNGDVELQRNNRIYAGNKPSGLLVKIKYDGRRDSLANCPDNPVVDNANECTINDVNKKWYIKMARQKLNDFKGIKRVEDYKKEELIEKALSYGLEVDKKMKKIDIVQLIVAYEDEHPVENLYIESQTKKEEESMATKKNIYQKINEIKKEIMNMAFVMDQVMPTNLGGGEYASIGQYYKAINDLSMKHNLLFMWEVVHVYECERDLFKPQGKPPQHVWTVDCMATFIDTEDVNADGQHAMVRYEVSANGSDICDKGVSGASSLAFRNWFDKNFTPSHIVVDDFTGTSNEVSETSEQTSAPKVPTYIPQEKKEEIKQEVVSTPQHEESDEEDIKRIITKIMKVRELSGDENWGAVTINNMMSQTVDTANLLAIELKVDNKIDALGGDK